ncbi:hypothetical protein AB4161_21995 [Vibrio sp. 10N.286.51.E5]|uniref:hypothetical protein n=1 Tax=Vibrio sp. 10N.286.51.E5 TaxID=3229709 RepID=UPI00354FE864
MINTLVAGLSLKLIRYARPRPTDALCLLQERFPEHAAELKWVAEFPCRLLEK